MGTADIVPAASSFLTVLGNSFLFFAVATLLLTVCGFALASLTIPMSLQKWSWLLAPFFGYSLLTIVSSWLVAVGATMEVALLSTVVLSVLITSWAMWRRSFAAMGYPRPLLVLIALSFPSFAITALTMAHNGSLAYVGGVGDLYLFVPLAEWLKTHGAPLFSLSSPNLLAPYWNANVPPIGGWLDPAAHLAFQGHRGDDSNFLLQRGSVYLQASLAILLGWDASLVFRPTQAFVLALSAPATFAFCGITVRCGNRTAALAAAFVTLNGTVFAWVAYGHPGQAASLMLVPVAIALTIAAIESAKPIHTLAAAILLSSILISYYQVAPLLVSLLAPPATYLLVVSRDRRRSMLAVTAVALFTIAITIPEQIKLALIWVSGTLIQQSGWGDGSFPPLSDALGTTLLSMVFDPVANKGQLHETQLALLGGLFSIATGIALAFTTLGLIIPHQGIRKGHLRLTLFGGAALLAYLHHTNYAYGYSKTQAGITFLIAAALSIGMASTRRIMLKRTMVPSLSHAARYLLYAASWAAPLALVTAVMAINLGLAAYSFWKPVGNIWTPRIWEDAGITKALPKGALTSVSPNILSDPEAAWMGLYQLRYQLLQGPVAMRQMVGVLSINPGPATKGSPPPAVRVMGTSEVPAASGFLESDRIWGGSLLAAYGYPDPQSHSAVHVDVSGATGIGLPARLPATLTIQEEQTTQAGDQLGYLLLTLAAQSPADIEITGGQGQLSTSVVKGVAVRAIPARPSDRITMRANGTPQPAILTAIYRTGDPPKASTLDYPKALAAVGDSRQEGGTISTTFDYLDVAVPASHSLDVFDSQGTLHPAWIKLPTSPDDLLKRVVVDLDASSLRSSITVNGTTVEGVASTKPIGDGEYVVYFSTEYGAIGPARTPLYRYRLQGGQVVEFEAFPLCAVWDGRSELSNWH